MSWKNWPAWLKGGVIGGIIMICYSIFVVLFKLFGMDYFLMAKFNFIDKLISGPIFYWFPESESLFGIELVSCGNGFISLCLPNIFGLIIICTQIFIFYFLIGSLIGLIIQKIKSRNKEKVI